MKKIPKLEPCPDCKTTKNLEVFKYDRMLNHVECIRCNYIGPGERKWQDAVKSHNNLNRQPTTETQGKHENRIEAKNEQGFGAFA